MSKSVIVTLFSTLMLSISVNAWAIPPISSTDIVVDEIWIADCDTYDVRVSATTKIRETLFFNQEGDPDRLRLSIHILGSTFYNCPDNLGYPACAENPSIFIQQGRFGIGENAEGWIDLVTGEERFTGAQWRLTLPGIGLVMIDA